MKSGFSPLNSERKNKMCPFPIIKKGSETRTKTFRRKKEIKLGFPKGKYLFDDEKTQLHTMQNNLKCLRRGGMSVDFHTSHTCVYKQNIMLFFLVTYQRCMSVSRDLVLQQLLRCSIIISV